MKFSFISEDLVESKTLHKTNIIIFVLFSIALFTLFQVVNLFTKLYSYGPVANVKLNAFQSIQSSFDQNLFFPWAFGSILVFIICLPIGSFSKLQNKSLSEIIISKTFKISYDEDPHIGEVANIQLNGLLITISWENLSGPSQNWKILVSFQIQDNEAKYVSLAKLLCMEKGATSNEKYQKTILVKEWPRQEYLINYWLKGIS